MRPASTVLIMQLSNSRELLLLVQERMDADDDVMDKIQEKQLQWLCDNLKMFISQMS